MATLTEVSVVTRKVIIWIVVVAILYLVLRVVYSMALNYWIASNPPEDAPPNVLFGPISPPKFPDSLPTTASLRLTLLTIEGGPQEATAAGKVYFMPKKLQSLLAPQKARETANRLKFLQEPEIVSSTLYRFRDPNRTFELDIVNNNFVYTYNYKEDISVFSNNILNKNTAVSLATRFFNSTGAISSSMLSLNTVQLLHFDEVAKLFSPATKEKSANSARVNFFRPDLDGLPLLTPEHNKSYIYAIVTPHFDEDKQVVEAHYNFWPIDFSNFGTYPLRSSDKAWEDVKDGNGVVATFGQNPQDAEIIIRKVYLAYYDSGLPETYMQPIFVFDGDNGFVAYANAIADEYLSQAAQ